MMSKEEKTVLTRFKSLLAENVFMSESFLEDLRLSGLLTANYSTLARESKTNERKMAVVVQSVLDQNNPEGLSRLCSALEKTGNDDAQNLSRSLRANLRIEKGEIEPRRQVIDQAAVYVHKKFGHSKKFSQGDKNDIIRAMAIKFEADSAVWHHDMKQTEDRLSRQIAALQERDVQLSTITESLLKFHRQNEARLTTHAHDKDSTSQFLWKMSQLDAKTLTGLELLHRHLEEFLTRVDVNVYVSETLQRERQRSLKLLGVKGDGDKGHTMDRFVAHRLKGTDAEKLLDDNQNDVIRELTSQVAALQSTVARQRGQVDVARGDLEKADKTIAELRKLDKPVSQVASKPYHRAMWA